MAEPLRSVAQQSLGAADLPWSSREARQLCRSSRTSCISNRWYRTPGQLAEIIRHTARRARGSTGRSARYTEELT